MNNEAVSRVGIVLSGLVFVAIAAAAYPLLSSGGVVYRTISLDFGPVAPWFAMGAALLVLGRIAALACLVLRDRPVSPSRGTGAENDANVVFVSAADNTGDDEITAEPELLPHPFLRPAAIAQGILQGLGGAVLVAACLLFVAGIPDAIAARPGAPDLESMEKYLQVFGSLVKWVFVAGVFFAFTEGGENGGPLLLAGTALPLEASHHTGDRLPAPVRRAGCCGTPSSSLAG